jgi:hypothetical protein
LSDQLTRFMGDYLAEDRFSSDEARFALANALSEVGQLEMLKPCPCPNDFCGSFYTGERITADEAQTRGLSRYTFPLDADCLIIDVVDGHTTYVEVLFRPQIKAKVDAFFGRTE